MKQKTSGIALIAALMIMVVVGLLVSSAVVTASIQNRITRNDANATQAFFIAQYGAQEYKTLGYRTYSYMIRNLSNYSGLISASGAGECANILGIGMDINRDGVIDQRDLRVGIPTAAQTVTLDDGSSGTFTITLLPAGRGIRSESTYRDARSVVLVGWDVEETGVWNNAIFAGTGQSGNGINGNTNIYGSVNVRGSNLSINDTAYDCSGNCGVFNSYSGDGTGSSNLGGLSEFNVPDSQRNINDLCSKVRVYQGDIKLRGSALIGTSTNKVKGVYVSNPVVSNDSTSQVDLESASRIHSEETGPTKPVTAYDLASPTPFPNLDNGTPSYRTNLNTLATDVTACLAGRTSGTPPTFVLNSSTTSFNCTSASGATIMAYNASTNQLTLNGVAKLSGVNFSLQRDVTYTGKGNLFLEKLPPLTGVGGNALLEGNLINASGTLNTYPQGASLGLTAEGNINANKNQQKLAGAFYAQGSMVIQKQATVLGTVVANYFDLTQTPALVQSPMLRYNLPPGMPGAGPTDYVFNIRAWERR
ncbi:pilus assembly PilX N-terminal domain-containing protein [Deinococcus peraridilitoris]|uniref:Type 4 fimbrial biogenesis protein PilX N-terminal domain-containing protein n=1 Tax=Deinococcus peraridilitoris (strain DSM 19664 / LMG 22246 / CIP 109416 / KR-200) TaxID=937777 RepID=L0A2P5_DEIPD|nr:pilus assembly PilX N-terminal domain-containing protein [Deinococcus peraridilitoris]AFZ67472.1 hypothetical protein Deipe_1969 [Deinococcus peraridilitoris DSM 19664]